MWLELEWKDQPVYLRAIKDDKYLWFQWEGKLYSVKLSELKNQIPSDESSSTDLKKVFLAPMPARVLKVFVKSGDFVKKEEMLLTLGAMKMEYSFQAKEKGQVEKVFCKEGESVDADQVLIKLNYEEN